MDPNAAVRMLENAVSAGDLESANEHYQHITEWRAKGGFMHPALVNRFNAVTPILQFLQRTTATT